MNLRVAWTRIANSAQSSPATSTPSALADRVSRGVIIGGGVLVFALFAFAHLGLGAWLVPPAATTQRQVVKAGPYAAVLVLNAGQFTVGQHNSASLELRDGAGKPVDGAKVQVQPVMTTMPMQVPGAQVVAQGSGVYLVRPEFSMAGTWRLDATIMRSGQPAQHASFTVGVRWP